jgi:hypothetical protein
VAASSAIIAVALPQAAYADAPAKQMTQVPGYYRIALGEFEVTAPAQRTRCLHWSSLASSQVV